MLRSIVEPRATVAIMPEFTGERLYMVPFRWNTDLGRWNGVVDKMLEGVRWDGPAYLMVDQQKVQAGAASRRPGLHVDGWWDPGLSCHQRGHTVPPPSHRQGHRQGGHVTAAWKDEGIFLLSNIQGCRALTGEFVDDVRVGGDCSHIDVSGMTEVMFEANRVYAGNVTMLHESLPVLEDCFRTVVRINVPGYKEIN